MNQCVQEMGLNFEVIYRLANWITLHDVSCWIFLHVFLFSFEEVGYMILNKVHARETSYFTRLILVFFSSLDNIQCLDTLKYGKI
jgi:hypothetical protein